MTQRIASWVAAFVMIAAACGGGELTLTEYAAEIETAVQSMNMELDALDLTVAGSPSLDAVRNYATERVKLRYEFVETLEALEPPDRVREFHESGLAVIVRLAESEEALAVVALSLDDPADFVGLWETEAGLAARAADADAIAICKAAQAEFDATEENAAAQGVPWIPPEMKEIVRVAFYCERSARP